jgi:H+/gluconate symporter-like permease
MRRILNMVLVVAGVFASVMVAPPKTVAVGVATTEFHNSALVYGLHVALPGDMRNFPAALVPLP